MSVINLIMLQGFPGFPSNGYFHVKGKARFKIVVIWGVLDIISWQEMHLKDSKSGSECHGAESSSPAAALPPPTPVVCHDASSAANFP